MGHRRDLSNKGVIMTKSVSKFYQAIAAQKDIGKHFGPKPKGIKFPPLTPNEQRRIEALYEQGLTQAEIARKVELAPSTVYNFITRTVNKSL